MKKKMLLYFSTIISKLIQFFVIPIYSSILSVKDYGSFDLYTTIISLLIPIIGLSVEEAVFRFGIDENSNEKKTVLSTGLFIYIINGLFGLTLSFALGIILQNNFVFLLSFWCAGALFFQYNLGCLRTLKKLDYYAFFNVFMTLAIAVSSVFFLIILRLGISGLVLGYAVGYFITNFLFVLYAVKIKCFSHRNVSHTKAKKMVRYSIPLIANSISWWIVNVSDRLLITLFLGTQFNGIYAIACKVPSLCSSFFPVFSVMWQEETIDILEQEKPQFDKAFNNSICKVIPICAGIVSCNYILFHFFFDAKYYEARILTIILIASAVFQFITTILGGIQIGLMNSADNGKSTIIGAVSNFLINLALLKYLGLWAAAISTLVSYIVVCIIRNLGVRNKIRISIDVKTIIYALMFVVTAIITAFMDKFFVCIILILFSLIWFVYENYNMINKVLNLFLN